MGAFIMISAHLFTINFYRATVHLFSALKLEFFMSMILDLLIYNLAKKNSSFAILKIVMMLKLWLADYLVNNKLADLLYIKDPCIIYGFFSNISTSLVQTLYMLMISKCPEFTIWLIFPMLFLKFHEDTVPIYPWVIIFASMYVCLNFSYTVYQGIG